MSFIENKVKFDNKAELIATTIFDWVKLAFDHDKYEQLCHPAHLLLTWGMTWVHATAHMWRSQDMVQESMLFFHCVVPGAWIQVIKLGSKHLHLLSQLTGLRWGILKRNSEANRLRRSDELLSKLRTFAIQMTFPAKRLLEEGHGIKWIIQKKEPDSLSWIK